MPLAMLWKDLYFDTARGVSLHTAKHWPTFDIEARRREADSHPLFVTSQAHEAPAVAFQRPLILLRQALVLSLRALRSCRE